LYYTHWYFDNTEIRPNTFFRRRVNSKTCCVIQKSFFKLLINSPFTSQQQDSY
jgi:hypothetical protein